MSEVTFKPLARALSSEEWKIVFQRKMSWNLTDGMQVRLTDPTTKQSAMGRSIKLAYDKVMKPKK